MKTKREVLLEELVNELGLSLQLLYREIGGKMIISAELDKDLKIIAGRVEQITSEISTLDRG
jgi:hypothetical protein